MSSNTTRDLRYGSMDVISNHLTPSQHVVFALLYNLQDLEKDWRGLIPGILLRALHVSSLP
jgi:hypothetical protein